MKKYTYYRIGLFIGLLSLTTLSSCANTRQTLGLDWKKTSQKVMIYSLALPNNLEARLPATSHSNAEHRMHLRSVPCTSDIDHFTPPSLGMHLGGATNLKAMQAHRDFPAIPPMLTAIAKGAEQWSPNPARDQGTTPSPINRRMQVGLGL